MVAFFFPSIIATLSTSLLQYSHHIITSLPPFWLRDRALSFFCKSRQYYLYPSGLSRLNFSRLKIWHVPIAAEFKHVTSEPTAANLFCDLHLAVELFWGNNVSNALVKTDFFALGAQKLVKAANLKAVRQGCPVWMHQAPAHDVSYRAVFGFSE